MLIRKVDPMTQMTNETVIEYQLSAAEAEQVRESAARVALSLTAPTDPLAYDEHRFLDAALPQGLRQFLTNFRRTESAAVALVHGFPVDDGAIGPTPSHWDAPEVSDTTTEQETFLAMCATALGDPFSWSTLQLGRMVQDILPIQGDELRQSGHGSESLLELHTEDGFHPNRCDYLLLFGLRNPERSPTIVASVRDIKLDDEALDALLQPSFQILPDDEHIRQLRLRYAEHPALARMEELKCNPVPVPVLFGDRDRPYLRIDLPFMKCLANRSVAARALAALTAELERVQQSVVVEQGSLLVIDNYLAVHGRQPFRARYDGTDRWLKRMIVSRDLRKAADGLSDNHRVLF
jgi:L-asparagine oxygenase